MRSGPPSLHFYAKFRAAVGDHLANYDWFAARGADQARFRFQFGNCDAPPDDIFHYPTPES